MIGFDAILARSFRAINGETGVRPEDFALYLDACADLGVEVVGWELWLIDHVARDPGEPSFLPGKWTTLIPARGAATPVAIGGDGDADECRAQLTALDLDGIVEARWRPFLRINFKLDV